MKCLLPLLLVTLFSHSQAQDLIINGSFEDANICTELKAPCSPSAWFFIKSHPEGYSRKSVIKASDGNHILQLLAVDVTNNKRSYWQTMLQCKLIEGQEYIINVDMAALNIGPNLNDLGFYFTDNFITGQTDTIIQLSHYQSMIGSKVEKLNDGWFRLHKKFIADSDNQYLVMGNFSPLSNKQIISKRKAAPKITYFIDKLSILPSGKTNCNVNTKLKDSLYRLTKRHTNKML